MRLITLLLIVSCFQKEQVKQKEQVEETVINDNVGKLESENFKVFLSDFSQDSSFQKSRIIFPFDDCYIEPTGDSLCYKVDKLNWIHLVLVEGSDVRSIEYSCKTSGATSDEIIYSIEGIENGTGSFYYFERKKGQWYLKRRLSYI